MASGQNYLEKNMPCSDGDAFGERGFQDCDHLFCSILEQVLNLIDLEVGIDETPCSQELIRVITQVYLRHPARDSIQFVGLLDQLINFSRSRASVLSSYCSHYWYLIDSGQLVKFLEAARGYWPDRPYEPVV